MTRFAAAGAYWKHMRMPFQLLLAPLFLWGYFLGQQEPDLRALIGFVSLHLFLYPGGTAFNSAYDRDVGPVSGMAEPPAVPSYLLAFSVGLQLVGFLLALFVGLAFTLLYSALAFSFFAYSHPSIRWKGRPAMSALTVFLGQGVLGFAAGWMAGAGEPRPLGDPAALVGGVVAGLTALGLYPSTQIFQVDEDAARGDRTLAVAFGPAVAVRAGAACLALAGVAAAALMLRQLGLIEAALAAGGFALLAVRHELFARRLDGAAPASGMSYRWATTTRHLATAYFLTVLVLLLLRENWRQ